MKKHIAWIIFQFLHLSVLYGAFALNLNGAMNILYFFVWVMLPMAFILLSDRSAKLAVKDEPSQLKATISALQRWSTLLLLVWNGHIATSIVWGVVMVLVAIHTEKVQELRTSPEIANAKGIYVKESQQ